MSRQAFYNFTKTMLHLFRLGESSNRIEKLLNAGHALAHVYGAYYFCKPPSLYFAGLCEPCISLTFELALLYPAHKDRQGFLGGSRPQGVIEY